MKKYFTVLIIVILFSLVFLTGCSTIKEPFWHVPSTVSPKAQAFLAVTIPVPDENPSSGDEWLRDQKIYDATLDITALRVRAKYDFTETATNIGGTPVLEIIPENYPVENHDKVLIYIHGGAYTFGSAKSTVGCSIQMAHFSGLKVLSIDYGLAPEHPFPEGLDQCLAVYRELLKTYSPDKIGVFGDSAGGALVLAMVLKARDEGLAMPAAVALLSPWTDITPTGDTYYTLEGIDPVLNYEKNLRHSANAYAGKRDKKHPLISPIYADYSKGFPTTLIHIGTREIFMSNAARLQRKMLDANVDVHLTLWEGMWHVFQYIPPITRESKAAYIDLSKFFHDNL
jgi:acetyl esterase/lipase